RRSFRLLCNQISTTAAKQGAGHQTDSCSGSFVSVPALNSVMRRQCSTCCSTCSAGSSADQCSLILGHSRATGQEKPKRADGSVFVFIHSSLPEKLRNFRQISTSNFSCQGKNMEISRHFQPFLPGLRSVTKGDRHNR